MDSPSWGPFWHPCVWASSPATTHTESRPRSPRSGPSWPRVSAECPLHAPRADPVFGCGEGEPGDWPLGCPSGQTRAAPSSTAAGAGPAGTLQLQPSRFPGACSSEFGGRDASPCAGTRGPRGRPGRRWAGGRRLRAGPGLGKGGGSRLRGPERAGMAPGPGRSARARPLPAPAEASARPLPAWPSGAEWARRGVL